MTAYGIAAMMSGHGAIMTNIKETKVKSVKRIENTGEYVYDIGMANDRDHWFFANALLVHNSAYFSAFPTLKEEIEAGKIQWTKEDIIEIYDRISDDVSDTFPQFLNDTFNVPFDKSTGVIKAGREIVAENGLFITKKRYAALVYDDEGTRKDVDGKPGKVKVVGLDLKRSDTPKFVQEFLMDILVDTLTDKGKGHILDKVKKFKKEFNALKPWEKGSPKAVNNLTMYKKKQEAALVEKMQGKKVQFSMPGHVSAGLNWNHLRDINNDKFTGAIIDGQKVIVCKLRETPDNLMTSIAYPVDELHLPVWFTKLPFDEDTMMHTIVDKKVDNLLGVLKWDFSRTDKQASFMDTLFDFTDID